MDRAAFDSAQDLLAERGEDHARRAAVNSQYLLGGLIVCQSRGHHILGTAARGRSNRYRYYCCYRRNRRQGGVLHRPSRIESLSVKLRGLKARQLELTDAIGERQILPPAPSGVRSST